MVPALKYWLFVLILLSAAEALAAGVNNGVAPGARRVSGKITEWPVPPSLKYARDPAIGPDGCVYFTARASDKIARFDPKSKAFQEWEVPAGMRPRGLLVSSDNKVLFGGSGNSAIGELDPSSGKVKLYKIPSNDSDLHTLVFDLDENVWFTQRTAGNLAKLERTSGKITEYRIGDDPYSLSLDKRGHVWVSRKSADRIARLDPKTGQVTELTLPKGSQPRRTAVSPDGMLWVSLYGTGKLAKIDPSALRVAKEYDLPGGPNAGPYAVNADADGRIWVSETQTNKGIMLDPVSGAMRVFRLPTRDSVVRKAAIDADGRYWYLGINSGKLGVIE